MKSQAFSCKYLLAILSLALSACTSPIAPLSVQNGAIDVTVPSQTQASSTSSTPPAPGDPCLVRNLETASSFEFDSVFRSEAARSQFRDSMVENPEATLKEWLKSTSTFQSVASEDLNLLSLDLYPQGGFGSFQLDTPSQPGKNFFVKVGEQLSQVRRSWGVQNSIVAHPECLIRPEIRRIAPTAQQLAAFPKIPQLLESQKFRNGVRMSEHFSDWAELGVTLSEMAEGDSGAAILEDGNAERISSLFYSIGKSLAAFHYLLTENPDDSFEQWQIYQHGNLKLDHLFWNANQQKITLSDVGSMKQKRLKEERDSAKVVYRTFDRLAQDNLFAPLIRIIDNEARRLRVVSRARLPVGQGEVLFRVLLEGGLQDAQTRANLFRDPVYIKLRSAFSNYSQFVKGYLSIIPESKHREVRRYFGNKCRKTQFKTIALYSGSQEHRRLSSLEPELVAAIRGIWPSEFLACVDQDQFD